VNKIFIASLALLLWKMANHIEIQNYQKVAKILDLASLDFIFSKEGYPTVNSLLNNRGINKVFETAKNFKAFEGLVAL
jgi:hypothetical protein